MMKRHAVDHYVLQPCQNRLLEITPALMPGMGKMARFRTNRYGIRGPEFSEKDDNRIIAIGCSVALSMFADQDRCWSYRLQALLSQRTDKKVWIGVLGKDELSTRDMVTMMRYFVPQFPSFFDSVLVWVGINDVALMLSKQDRYDPDYVNNMSLAYQLRHTFIRSSEDRPKTSHIPAYDFLACLKHRFFVDRHENAGAFYHAKRMARQMSTKFVDSLPDLTLGLNEFERNLSQIIDLATSQSIKPVFATPVAIWKENQPFQEEQLLWFGWIHNSANYYSTGVLSKALQCYVERLKEVCHARSVQCIDLEAILPKDTSAFYDDVHMNENGSMIVAQTIADRWNV